MHNKDPVIKVKHLSKKYGIGMAWTEPTWRSVKVLLMHKNRRDMVL
jgi:hypothetical protein